MIPGTFLRKRREAAGLSIAEVAAAIPTDPRIPEHDRAEWIELIERGDMPASFHTVVALRRVVPFDIEVLAALAQGYPAQLCRVCACSQDEACIDARGDCCAWAEPDLCTACVGKDA